MPTRNDIVYVDKNDKAIGSSKTLEAYRNGHITRLCRMFIINKDGFLLIQQRAKNLTLPNKWCESASGHVDVGESYEEAAYRELKEEMGITDVKLREIKRYYGEEHDEVYVKKRFNAVFVGRYDGKVNICKDEVSSYRWEKLEAIKKEIADNPDTFTEGFIKAFKIFLDISR